MSSPSPTTQFEIILGNGLDQAIAQTQPTRPPIPPTPSHALITLAQMREEFYGDHIQLGEPLLPDSDMAALFLGPADGVVVREPETCSTGKENVHLVRGILAPMLSGGQLAYWYVMAEQRYIRGREKEGGRWGVGLADLGGGENLDNRVTGLLAQGRLADRRRGNEGSGNEQRERVVRERRCPVPRDLPQVVVAAVDRGSLHLPR